MERTHRHMTVQRTPLMNEAEPHCHSHDQGQDYLIWPHCFIPLFYPTTIDWLRGNQGEEASQALSIGMQQRIDTQQLCCLLNFPSCLLKINKLQTSDCDCCSFVPSSPHQWHHETSMHGKSIKYITRANFFFSSLVKSKPTWLCSEESQFESKMVLLLYGYWLRKTNKKRYFYCMDSN